jgi:hypothetical protein
MTESPGTTSRSTTRVSRSRRAAPPKSAVERYRTLIIGAIAVIAVVAVGYLAFASAGAASFTCSTIWEPEPTASPAPGATPDLGYVQPDQGKSHEVDSPQPYTLCPPASGNHRNLPGAGPIQARFYGPEDRAEPMGWIHNLEHGGIVILYRCEEGDDCGEGRINELRNVYNGFPPSPICGFPAGELSPVIARFDEMAWPYAVLIWNRVLPLETLDVDTIHAFYAQWGERSNPEKLCEGASPSPSVEPSGSASPAESTEPSGSADPSPAD